MGHASWHHYGVTIERIVSSDASHQCSGEYTAHTLAISFHMPMRTNYRVVHLLLQAITQDKQDLRNMYECPVYKTRTRGPTYVWTFNLKSKDKPSKWTLAGVALLLQV